MRSVVAHPYGSPGNSPVVFRVKVACTERCRTTAEVQRDDLGVAGASGSTGATPYARLLIGG
jgi:hypothetical protein